MVIQPESATRQVVNTITTGIRDNTFVKGHRLPSQRKLVELFEVSRTVIREAIKILEGQGIVVSKKGSGIFITEQPELYHKKTTATKHETVTALEILNFSKAIWHSSCQDVVRQASDEEVESLRNTCQSFHERYGTKTTLQEKYIYETSFGMKICHYSHNSINYLIMLQLMPITNEIDYAVVSDFKRFKKILNIDKKIIQSFLERDSMRAYFWANERDREIATILRSKKYPLEKKIKINFDLYM